MPRLSRVFRKHPVDFFSQPDKLLAEVPVVQPSVTRIQDGYDWATVYLNKEEIAPLETAGSGATIQGMATKTPEKKPDEYADADKRRDDALRRALQTPPTQHKAAPKGKKKPGS